MRPCLSAFAIVATLTTLLGLAGLTVALPSLGADDASQQREHDRSELHQVGQELAKLSRAFNLIHEIVAPSVVSIHTRETRRFYGMRNGNIVGEVDLGEVEEGEGSGLVFASNDKASFVLTNAHVVLQTGHDQQFLSDQNGHPIYYDKVRVVLNDNREADATYVGVYIKSDLAVLKIPIPRLPAVEWADSDQAKVGDWVVALGYPLGVGYSATSGIISATDRSTGIYNSVAGFDSFIQTDAAINPGNSGGPLVNIMGQVVGINASIISTTKVNIGIGFAIPSNLARRVAEDLLENGQVITPLIGVGIEELNPDQALAAGLPQVQTVRISSLYPNGPSEAAGLAVGDIIVSVNNVKIVSRQQFRARVASTKIGDAMVIRISRNNTLSDHSVVPIPRDKSMAALKALAQGTTRLVEFGLWLHADGEPGLLITNIDRDSTAFDANLKVGDRVLLEQTLGEIRTLNDVASLAKRRELVLQIYQQDGRSYWVRLRR